MNVTPYIRLCRPTQYVKNLLIFAPAFFALAFRNNEVMSQVLLTFVAFCLTASGVYIFNDIHDVEDDRRHPLKRKRPIAAGEVSLKLAWLWLLVVVALGLGLGWLVSVKTFQLLLAYWVMNLLYTLKLKELSLIDINIISLGFVIRLFVGGEAAAVELSKWIVVITYLLALFLALAKRRDDVFLALKDGKNLRKASQGYNMEFLNGAMSLVSAIVIVAYLMYTVSPEVTARVHTDKLYLTALFVTLGFLRYMQLTFVENRGGNPTGLVLSDGFLIVVILAWVGCFAWLIY